MLRTTIYARIAARFPSTLRSNFRPIDIATTSLRSAPRRTFASSKSTSFTISSNGRPTLRNSTILQRLQNSIRHFRTTRRRYNGAGATATEEPTTLGGRLKKLSREYGWSALGVYLALSALDFPFCYLLVKYLGTERIGRWEEVIVSNVKRFIPESVKQTWHDWRSSMKSAEHAITGSEDVNEHIDKIENDFKLAEQAKSNSSEWRFNFGKHNGETLMEVANSDPSYISWIRKEDVATQRGDLAMALKEYDASKSWFSWGFTQAKPVEVTSDATNPVEGTSEAASAPAPDAWGVEAATEKNKHDASLATQLALAYAIHKSFIFVRVPITAAVTPKVVQILRGWGWDIGKRTTKEAKALKRASIPVKKPKARWAGKPKPKAE